MAGTSEGARKAAETLRKRKEQDPEFAAKLAQAVVESNQRRTGEKYARKEPSAEAKERQRQAVIAANQRRKGQVDPFSPEAREKQRLAVAEANRRRKGEKRPNMKSTHTPESDAKRSASMAARWADPAYRARMEAIFANPDIRAVRSRTMSATMQKIFADPARRQAHRDNALRMAANNPVTPHEMQVIAALTSIGFIPAGLKHVGTAFTIHDVHSGREMDVYIPDLMLDVEVDGEAHSRGQRLRRDRERDQELSAAGYKILRLTHTEIDDGSFVTKLLNALEGSV